MSAKKMCFGKGFVWSVLCLLFINAFATPTHSLPVVEVYMMSLCPDACNFIRAFAPISEVFQGYYQFKPRFIANVVQGGFTSLHGEDEVRGDKLELCVHKKFEDKYIKWLACLCEVPPLFWRLVDTCSLVCQGALISAKTREL
eukprot:TRINITY_DN182_c0_g1_i4.p1 TRINITY_DN182_c0_g1~~TRINITY_DN182_c0_g1_i4.p1  ORF type:complete len:143 (-),score=6.97 TRINITY_DN182_c0_g1_i4:348-776(-)